MDKTNACHVIDREISALFDKPLSAQSVDLLFKLTNIRNNIKSAYTSQIQADKGNKNNKHDRDINLLFENYVLARKGKNECVITSELESLLNEISFILIEIYNTATCEKERQLIEDSVRKISMH